MSATKDESRTITGNEVEPEAQQPVAEQVTEASTDLAVAEAVEERRLGNIFVTGGSGFVGRELLSTLLSSAGSEGTSEIRAVCRSSAAAEVVQRIAGQQVLLSNIPPDTEQIVRVWEGDLTSVERLVEGMHGCDTVFHCAASVEQHGDWDNIYDINVAATRRCIVAARRAGVRTFVHVSSEAVLVGSPIHNADEQQPYSEDTDGMYPRSKRMAEEIVLEEAGNASSPTLLIVRPRFIWGRGDTTILPAFVQAVRSGQFKWFGSEDYRTSTCHVANCVEGMIKAAKFGRHSNIYFLTDGQPQSFRTFVSRLLGTQDIDTSNVGSVPVWLASGFAATSVFFHNLIPALGTPTLVPATLRIIGEEVTVNDQKARRELHYTSHISVDQGLDELRRIFEVAQARTSSSSAASPASSSSSQTAVTDFAASS